MGKKVLVIGLDGATWDLIKPWADKGELPTFKKLMEGGVWGELESAIPPLSCPAWLSVVTGKNPGKLGTYDFLIYDSNDYSTHPVNPKFFEGKGIWDMLSCQEIRVGVVNVPMSTPHPLNGFIVSGMFTPNEDEYVYPPELKAKLNDIADQYELDITQFDYSNEGKFIEDVYRILDKRKKVVEYLMDTQDRDFLMVVFTTPDRIQHFLWKYIDPKHPLHDTGKAQKYKDAIKDFWQRIDQILRKLIEKSDNETNVIIISDHGFGTHDMVFYVNDWLKEQGYLRLKQKEKSFLTKLGFFSESISSLLKKLRLYGFVIPLIPKRLRNLVPSKYPSFERMKDKIDWEHTKAYSAPHSIGCEQIYINLRGCKPYGSIELKEYETTRAEIIEKLRRLQYPQTNKQMKVEVFKPEEIYVGDYVNKAPDILYLIEQLRCVSDKSFGHQSIFEKTSINPRQNASHRTNGIFLAYGPDIKKSYKIENAKIYDIVPTILHIFGLPIPNDVDGRILNEIFKEDSQIAKRKPRFITPDYRKEGQEEQGEFSKEDAKRVKERLRALGYLD